MTESGKYQIFRFGVFELNVATEELRKSGTLIHLPPQPLHLLAFLASRAGQIVTREEIEQTLWKDEADLDFERRINQCIKQIRAALSDNAAQPVYIETLRTHGYRFLVPVVMKHSAAPSPKITISDSSGLERDLAARVLARIQASGGNLPTGGPPATTTATIPNAATPTVTNPAAAATVADPAPSEPPAAPSRRRLPLLLLVTVGAVVLALLTYLIVRH